MPTGPPKVDNCPRTTIVNKWKQTIVKCRGGFVSLSIMGIPIWDVRTCVFWNGFYTTHNICTYADPNTVLAQEDTHTHASACYRQISLKVHVGNKPHTNTIHTRIYTQRHPHARTHTHTHTHTHTPIYIIILMCHYQQYTVFVISVSSQSSSSSSSLLSSTSASPSQLSLLPS